jgi:predicted SAM-dependent methyltransferase
MQNPFLAIFMVTYNQEKYISQAIESVLMQNTSFPIKLFIGEDFSTDKTKDICIRYANLNKDKIELVSYSKNIGATNNALNIYKKCLQSGAKYIAILEGDDYWTDSYKLQKQVDFLENNVEYSYVCSRFKILENDSGNIKTHMDEIFSTKEDKIITIDNLFNPFISKAMTIVFRSELIKDLNFNSKYFRDLHLFMHLLLKGKGYCINQEMGIYRKSSSGIWSMIDENRRIKEVYEIAFDLLKTFGLKINSLNRFYKNSLQNYKSNLVKNGLKYKCIKLNIRDNMYFFKSNLKKKKILTRLKSLLPVFVFQIKAKNKKKKELKQKEIRLENLFNSKHPIKIEIGSGPKKGTNGWITIDLVEGCDFQMNLLEKFPFNNNSVDFIYSSHFLEHFQTHEIKSILKECYRVLKPGGKISTCVPDASIYIKAYINNDDMDTNTWLRYKPAVEINSKIDYINYIAYMNGEHKHMYDLENLIAIHRISGFANSTSREFDEKIDMEMRDYQSIYVEATKEIDK